MKKYFIHNGTDPQGPFDIAELKAQKIQKDTMIWYEGLSNWTKAEDISELQEIFTATVTPPFLKTPPPITNTKKIDTATQQLKEPQSTDNKETILHKSTFGLISDQRVVFYNKKNWIIRGERIDVKLQDIRSVELNTKRPIIRIILFVSIAVWLDFLLILGVLEYIETGKGIVFLIGFFLICLIPLVLSILWVWGSPRIIINVLDAYKNEMVGFPWDRKHAEEFVDILRKRAFDRL